MPRKTAINGTNMNTIKFSHAGTGRPKNLPDRTDKVAITIIKMTGATTKREM